MTLRSLLVSGLALLVAAGCDPGDGDDTAGDPGATSGDDPGDEDPTAGPSTDPGATTGEDPDPSATDDGATSSATDPVIPWGDVACGDATCTGGQVCVISGVDCDYGPCEEGMEAEWVSPPPRCEALPADCDLDDPYACLELEYCSGGGEFGSFADGTLECGPVALDCFCGF